MRHILLGYDLLRGAIVEVLTAGVPTGATAWEITSYESWQCSELEDE